jgi:predicted nuclease of predicted toxin-antitoxin system
VRLLFDQNLSYKLVSRVADIFPDSTQARLLGFARFGDSELWYYARTHGYIVVTKDEDIPELGILRGAPPKIVWLRTGNCSTAHVEQVLRGNAEAIIALTTDTERIILELFA